MFLLAMFCHVFIALGHTYDFSFQARLLLKATQLWSRLLSVQIVFFCPAFILASSCPPLQ